MSSHDASTVAINLLQSIGRIIAACRALFAIPPIAMVGLGEKQAREQGLKVRVKSEKASDWYAARRVAETVYGYKTLVEKDTGRIIAAHLVGPHADEVINIFGLAIRHGLTAEQLKTTIFGYPTGASDVGYML